MMIEEQLRNIFRDIEHLYGYEAVEDFKEYEIALKQIIKELFTLLNLNQISSKLTITTNIESIGTLTVWCHSDHSENNEIISFKNVIQLLEISFINNSKLHQIYHNLVDTPMEHYKQTAQKLLDIVENLLELQDNVEIQFIDYLSKCLLYDLNYYKSNEMEIPKHIDVLVNKINPHLMFDTTETFPYSRTEIYHPLSFNSSSDVLTFIYKTISNVLIVQQDVSIHKLARIIINLFRSCQDVSIYDIERIDVNITQLFPKFFKKVNSKYLSESKGNMILPQLSQVMNELIASKFDVNPNFIRIYKTFLRFQKLYPTLNSKEDYEFVKQVENSITNILELEAGDTFQSAIELFLNLQSSFNSTSATLLMKLSCLEFAKIQSVKKNTLELWVHKFEAVKNLDQTNQVICKTRQIFKVWLNDSKLYDDLLKLAIMEDKNRIKSLVFKKFKSTVEKRAELASLAVSHDQIKYINIMRNRCLSLIKRYENTQNHENTNLARNIIKTWNKKTKLVTSKTEFIENKLLDFITKQKSRTLRRYYNLWEDRVGNANIFGLNESLNQCLQARKFGIIQRYFERWLFIHNINKECKLFAAKRDERLRSNIFEAWKNGINSERKANNFLRIKSIEQIRTILIQWNKKTKSILKADEFYQSNLIKGCLQHWSLNHKFNFSMMKIEHNLKSVYFRLLINNFKANRLVSSKNRAITNVILSTLIKKNDEVIGNEAKANNALNKNLKARYLRNMLRLYENHRLLHIEAEKFYLHKYITGWHQSMLRWNIKVEGLLFSDKMLIRFALAKWKQKHEAVKEHENEQILLEFRIQADFRLIARILMMWNEKSLEKQAIVDELNDRLNLFTPNASLYFRHWLEKSKHVLALEDNVDKISNKLVKRLFNHWQSKLELVDELNDHADDYFTERSFILLKSKVQSWIFQFNKNIKRHYQLCESFQDRRSHRLKRNVFHLWSRKCDDQQLEEEELLANSTYVSNSSPLAKRTYQQQRQKYILPPTPNKPPSPRKVSTPRSSGTSPVKLHETSLRVRDQQINNLRERFSRARGSSTPKKEDSVIPMKLEYSVSLSPPKYRSPTQISPASNSSFDDPELSLLSTAKRMGRIKPIKFPTNEENEVKFSPASKLRIT
ncbi:SFI1 [Candida pseudojiufengensis]|uniref:SFI1 n=1 Tax=Candida pseudojiufengensis TaxID=497109 RepID=UPI0022242C21|nr:SFI1 [Candida pseudojiufengensis]KAI5959949.1 SFI1 [Candida pseudojiufengensis]